MSEVSYKTIDIDAEGRRLDNYLLSQYKHIPKSKIYSIIRKGEIRVNGGRVKAKYKLILNDKLRIPPLHLPNKDLCKSVITKNKNLGLLERVIFENKYYLVLNKPSGIPVHAGSGFPFGVIEWFREYYGNPDLDLVHRIDRGTSGCLVIAKTKKVLRTLQEIWVQKKVKKIYKAAVYNVPEQKDFYCNFPLKEQLLPCGDRINHSLMSDGDLTAKSAKTRFSVIDVFGNYSILKIQIYTGRKHQIRSHCKALNFPILGDEKYGNTRINRNLKKLKILNRMYLHAETIEFDCPLENKKMIFKVSFDEELKCLMKEM
jgi:23S rRNA pseudouridine955/2504/2580 synthase